MLNQVIDDMRSQLGESRQEVRTRWPTRAAQEAGGGRAEAGAGVGAARHAGRAPGRDDLARQASCASRSTASARRRTTRRGEARARTPRLRDALRQLSDKIQEATRKKNLLIAQQKRAEAQKRIHETMSASRTPRRFDAFERMAAKIEDNERQALAAAAVSGGPDGRLAGARVQGASGLRRRYQLDYKLLEMKQQMGLLPAAPAAQPSQGAPRSPTSQLALGPGDARPDGWWTSSTRWSPGARHRLTSTAGNRGTEVRSLCAFPVFLPLSV
jgi:phage shock protein A